MRRFVFAFILSGKVSRADKRRGFIEMIVTGVIVGAIYKPAVARTS
jgi:hypothetical protein